jgi:D-lactate dehydrogenase
MPTGAKKINAKSEVSTDNANKVVYFPSCINRAMGVSRDHKNEKQLSETIVSLIKKGGFEIIWAPDMDKLCCGMAFLSKGYTKAGEKKSDELGKSLLKASENGKYPVLCDMSPCFYTMKENLPNELKIYEPVEFILKFLMPNLTIEPVNETISVFPVCSMKKMGLDGKLKELAQMCSNKKVVVSDANCCGFAGDKGFTVPELNKHGLRHLEQQLCDENVKHGYSTSRTCEIGLSLHSGISHKSIVYLVDSVTKN